MSPKDAASEEQLEQLRQDIDSLDSQLLSILAERREKSRKAAEVKYAGQAPLRDRSREENLLTRRVQQAKENNLDSHLVTRVFHEILEDSIRYQQQFLQKKINDQGQDLEVKKVSFQGSRGSYSYLAAEQHFSRLEIPVVYQGCTTYQDVIELVDSGEVDYAVVPIENTTSGGINEVYDLLQRTRLSIIGEEKYKIAPCLLGLAGSKLTNIDKIYTHPQLALQCSTYLGQATSGQTGCTVQSSFNAVTTVEQMKQKNELNSALIGSEQAAEILGLEVLKRDIANYQENYTRFIVISRKPVKVDPRVPCKTSVVMATTQKPGALVEALQVFKDNNISMTKLESRPVIGNPSEELFYVDFEGNTEDEHIKQVVEGIRKHTKFLKVLGSYPSLDIERTSVPQQANSENNVGAAPRAKAPEVKTSKKSASYRLGSREYKAEDTIIEVKGVKIGGDSFVMIGGPCSVESENQIMQCAKHLRDTGGHVLRGGCFKPRTSPYSFQGMGYEGLDILVKAGMAYDFPVITEVLAVEDVQKVAEKSDMLQIGARNMQNFTLLQEVGRTQRPVMLKRGMSSSIDDLLNAAEYILSQGNQQVMLCERGIRTFETATRNTLDLSAVPVLRRETHLPVIVDPSHAAGERDLIIPLVYASKAVGAHGVMVEFHPNPEEALSDGPQALRFPQFEELMGNLR